MALSPVLLIRTNRSADGLVLRYRCPRDHREH